MAIARTPCIEVLASRDDEQTVVQVRDNGVSFCRENARVLFQPFTRLHGHDYAGHGIGLSIVRRAVERHGGRVWAEAAPDEARASISPPNAGIEALSITEPLANAAE